MIESKNDIQRLMAHYQDYQGLRLIPIGLFFGLAALGNFESTPWTDFVSGRVDSVSFGLIGLLIALYLSISFAYKKHYGSVVQDAFKKKDRIFSAVFLSAFILAVVTFRQIEPPVNTIMLVLAAGVCYQSLDGSRRVGRLILGGIIGVFALMPVFTGKPDAVYMTWFSVAMAIGFIGVGFFEHLTFRNLISSINHTVTSNG